jgi:Holliday junction resolvase
VIRAAGSKGATKVDLVAVKPGSLIFIQCKATGTLQPAEWDRLVEVAGWVGATPVLAANGPPRPRRRLHPAARSQTSPRPRLTMRAVPARRGRRGSVTGNPAASTGSPPAAHRRA